MTIKTVEVVEKKDSVTQTTTFSRKSKGWTFTIIRGQEFATLKTTRGSYELKQSHYNSRLFKGTVGQHQVQMEVRQGGCDLSWKPTTTTQASN